MRPRCYNNNTSVDINVYELFVACERTPANTEDEARRTRRIEYSQCSCYYRLRVCILNQDLCILRIRRNKH